LKEKEKHFLKEKGKIYLVNRLNITLSQVFFYYSNGFPNGFSIWKTIGVVEEDFPKY